MKKFYVLFCLLFFSYFAKAQNPDAFIMTFEVNNPNDLFVTIPISYDIDSTYSIDFGDGTILTNEDYTLSHLYSTIGTYVVTVSGNFNRINFSTIGNFSDNSHLKLKSIEQWGTTQWISMENAFKGCTNLVINATDAPDLSQVTSTRRMFHGAQSINQTINHWNVSNVTDMSEMFCGALFFNKPLNNWDVSNVMNMEGLFMICPFNQDISSWNTFNVTNMKNTFSGGFNQNINNWDVSNVTNMEGMFAYNPFFNQPIDNWDMSNVTNMSYMFNYAESFNQPIDNWSVSNVNDMSYMFYYATNFNQPLNNWDVSNVMDMSYMFSYSESFNGAIGDWDISNVTNIEEMFAHAYNFDQNINNWNVSNVTNMKNLFFSAYNFNQPLDNWNVSNVTNMKGMFYSATNFNQNIDNWNLDNVIDMSNMFEYTTFNQSLNNWSFPNATNIAGMFANASLFNQPLDNWNVSNITNMSGMFISAAAFNQNLTSWDISNVTNMSGMFNHASSFNQDLSIWNFNPDVELTHFVTDSNLSIENYDLLLLRFAQLGLENKTLNSFGMEFCNLYVRNYLKYQLGWTLFDIQSEDCAFNGIVSGKILFDLNENGCNVDEDFSVNSIFISADNGTPYYSTIANNGTYYLPLFDDSYTITLQNVPSYFSFSPESHIVSFSDYDNYEQLHFCLTAHQSVQDLNITILPISEARPGFEANYQIIVQNIGTLTMNNVLVSLDFDHTKQSFVNATPNTSSTTSNQLIWNITSLAPFQNQVINFTMQTFMPPTVNGNDILDFTATVSPFENDYTPNDNTFELAQIVVNSFDPNDKQVLQGNQINVSEVDEHLHYLIRFQNTGTASAINVRIEDELHESLDWNTIQIVNASHNFRVEIKDGNQMEFIFENIHLPYEAANEEGSHGFIAYKIKPIYEITVDDYIIGNQAEIYFDFNEPIITNSTSTQVVDSASTPSLAFSNMIAVFPNPSSGLLNIQTKEHLELEQVKIYNLQGRELFSSNENLNQININNLGSGIYLLSIKTNLGNITQRIVKK